MCECKREEEEERREEVVVVRILLLLIFAVFAPAQHTQSTKHTAHLPACLARTHQQHQCSVRCKACGSESQGLAVALVMVHKRAMLEEGPPGEEDTAKHGFETRLPPLMNHGHGSMVVIQTGSCLASPCLASPCLASPCLASPCLASPCLACNTCATELSNVRHAVLKVGRNERRAAGGMALVRAQ